MANYYDKDRTTIRAWGGGMQAPGPHHGMVSEYQQSGIPFCIYHAVGSETNARLVTITLPYVSRWIGMRVTQTADTCQIGFGNYSSSKGVQGENYILPSLVNVMGRMEIKCKKIYVYVPANIDDCVIQIVAGLTSIRDFPDLDVADLTGITQEAAVASTTTQYGTAAIILEEDA